MDIIRYLLQLGGISAFGIAYLLLGRARRRIDRRSDRSQHNCCLQSHHVCCPHRRATAGGC